MKSFFEQEQSAQAEVVRSFGLEVNPAGEPAWTVVVSDGSYVEARRHVQRVALELLGDKVVSVWSTGLGGVTTADGSVVRIVEF